MERRVIRVECMHDPAGIAAALRRAFAGPPQEDETDLALDDLLKRLH